MSFDEADTLCTRIMEFLVSCGGPYKSPNVLTEMIIMDALKNDQYVMKEVDGEIQFFACFWRLQPEDLVLVAQCELPDCITEGPVIYVTDAGCKAGIKGMRELAEALKKKFGTWEGVFWRSYKHDRIMAFPGCRGENYGEV